MPFSSFIRRLTLVAFLPLVAPAFAQAPRPPSPDHHIAGVVRHAETHAPLADVTVAAGDRRTVTGRDGRFALQVPAGSARLDLTLVDFYPLSATIDVAQADATDTEFLLVPRSGYSESVDVVAALPPAAAPSTVALVPSDVLRTPGALDNVFRTLQTLPGVSATEEFGSRLAVRGGAPDQNLTVMDGVEIHDPYRLFGLTSAFNPDTIASFELATGGFSVKYGDRLSSVLLVDNREGTRQSRLGGSASLSVTDANAVLEGRLPGKANGSWLVSARRTYYDLVASRVVGQDFPRFADVQAKGMWELAPGRTLSVFGLRSRQDAALNIDRTDARGEFNDNTKNDILSLRFDAALAASAQSHTTVSYSDSSSSFGVDAAVQNRSQRSNSPDDAGLDVANVKFERGLALRDLSLRQELSRAVGAHLLETGGDLHTLGTQLSYVIEGDRNPTAVNGSSQQGGAGLPDSLLSIRDTTRGALWMLDRWQMTTAVSVEGGVRLDGSRVNRETRVSPRVTVSSSIAPRTRLRASAGRYTQSPGYEKLVQGDYVLDLTGPEAGRLRSEHAVQASVELERDLASRATLRVEGYYKRSSQLLVGRLETQAELQARLAPYDFPPALASSVPADPIITTVPTNNSRGRAYGFDLFVSRTTAPSPARVRGWASYTWGRATREAYGRTYSFEYDRRHAFSAVASYRLSGRWELASTTRLASGFPRTVPLGLRVASVPDARGRLVPAVDPEGRLIYAVNFGGVENLNTARLPVFARVDLRATWRPRGPMGRWELYVEVVNLLNRKNAGSLDPRLQYDPTSDRPMILEQRDQGLPRLPTLGLRLRF